MRNMTAGGYVVDSENIRKQLPYIKNPNISDIENLLTAIRNKTGELKIKNLDAKESGPYEISLYTENEKYLIMLNEIDEDGEHHVRTFVNPQKPNDMANMMGEMYPARAIVESFSLAAEAIKEFLKNGDVSHELLR